MGKRAEIEKEYSKEMEGLSKQMRKKHKDIMSSTSSYVTSVENVLIQLIIETGDLARYHGGMEDMISTEMIGTCQNVMSDLQNQYKECKNAGHDIQENVLRSLYELQHNNKVLQKSQSNYENASKKQHDIRKEVEKIEKETKPEKLDKNKKHQEKKKSLGIKQDRMEKALEEAAQSQLNQVLSTKAA